jgi:hypothetical protein
MKMPVLVMGLTCLVTPALAADIKAGLWEMKVLKGVYDGQDTSAQRAALQEQARQAMAKMTPEQRKQMEAMMKDLGGHPGGEASLRMCITEEQARRKELRLDPEGRCQPQKTSSLLGDTIHYEFDCTTAQGVRMKGRADMKVSSTSIRGTTDMTTTDARGVTHTIQQETQMTWLGADCKGVAPAGGPKQN